VAAEAPEIGVWLAALGDCRVRTLKAIAGIGSDELDWACPLSKNTIGTLLYHIAAIELDWLYSEILQQEFPRDFTSWFPHDVRDSDGNLTFIGGESAERHQSRFQYVRDLLSAALGAMTLAEFRRVRHLESYDVTPEWVVHHLLQHESQHRGQIVIVRNRFKELNLGAEKPIQP
jgi:uncharacterized damage-inducible protein DinB